MALALVAVTLPASFYLASKPPWWNSTTGAPPWPPVGPDVVASGALAVTVPSVGSLAYKIPARLCFENSANDTDAAYTSTNPRVKSFSAATCYTASVAAPAIQLTPTSSTYGNVFVGQTARARCY